MFLWLVLLLGLFWVVGPEIENILVYAHHKSLKSVFIMLIRVKMCSCEKNQKKIPQLQYFPLPD